MFLRVVEAPRNADEARGCERDDRDPAKDQRKALVMPEGSGQLFEMQPASLFSEGGTRDGRDEEIELLDHEPEGDDRDPGPHPGEKSSFVGGVVAEPANYGGLPYAADGSRHYGDFKAFFTRPSSSAAIASAFGAVAAPRPCRRAIQRGSLVASQTLPAASS